MLCEPAVERGNVDLDLDLDLDFIHQLPRSQSPRPRELVHQHPLSIYPSKSPLTLVDYNNNNKHNK